MSKYVKLSEKANIFYDAGTGIIVRKGKITKLSEEQLRHPRIKAALNGGHLQYASPPADEKKANEVPIVKSEAQLKEEAEALDKKFRKAIEDGKTPEAIAKLFNLTELKTLAEFTYEMEIDDDDTKASLTNAIVEEIAGEEN